MRGPTRLLVVVLLASALGAAVVAASAREARSDSQPRRDQRPITRLMNEAIGAVQRDRACRPPTVRLNRRPSLTDDPPSTELLNTLGVLRRAQTDEERQALDTIRFLAAEGVYRNHIRISRSAAGAVFLIVPARDVSFYEPRPKRCVVELRRRFGKLIEDRPRRFRRRARRALEHIIRTEWTAPSEGQVEGVFLFDYDPKSGTGGGGGGVSARFIREQGLYGSAGRGRGRATVSGLLPDGVATLEATFARVASRGPRRPPKRYAKAVTRTVAVQDNVVSFSVPRSPADAFPSEQVWRAADGSAIREISQGGTRPNGLGLLRLTR